MLPESGLTCACSAMLRRLLLEDMTQAIHSSSMPALNRINETMSFAPKRQSSLFAPIFVDETVFFRFFFRIWTFLGYLCR